MAADLDVVTATWTGWSGAPGFTKFYAVVGNGPALSTAVNTFFGFITDLLPSLVTVTVAADGDQLDMTTGHFAGSWAGGTTASHGGNDSSGFAAPSGACITWNTGAVVGSRRLRGRTFIVPIGVTSYQPDGTLVDGRRAVLQVAAANLIASAGHPGVYSRTGHTWSVFTSANIADRVAVLRTRRS